MLKYLYYKIWGGGLWLAKGVSGYKGEGSFYSRSLPKFDFYIFFFLSRARGSVFYNDDDPLPKFLGMERDRSKEYF